jgi:hypothetical protein
MYNKHASNKSAHRYMFNTLTVDSVWSWPMQDDFELQGRVQRGCAILAGRSLALPGLGVSVRMIREKYS